MKSTTRKHSRKRDAILECLRSTNSHPSAEWVYSQLKPIIPDLSLGTVYRNLALFRSEGLITSVGVVNGLERFDADMSEHMHFVCSKCGAVIDVGPTKLPEELISCAALAGSVESCRITFTGVCSTCDSGAPTPESVH